MKIGILLSGGVDSSVALSLLQEANSDEHELCAYYLKVWLEDDFQIGNCPWEEDIRFVEAICRARNVPFEVIALQREYRERVVDYVLTELREGRTPSPDIFCNQRIKFGAFLARLEDEVDRIASGHYARTRVCHEADCNKVELLKGRDPVKDQTYFLSHMSSEQLERVLFPIGDLEKREVRERAIQLDLPTAQRPDSQGICFLGKIRFTDFVKYHLGEKPGPIVEIETGRKLGEHRGYWFHTIGQRRGLGLGEGPWFVVGKGVESNTVFVTHKDQLWDHARSEFEIGRLHWINEVPERDREYSFKLRHSPETRPGTLEIEGERARVILDEPDPGVSPGQFAIVYDGEVCLGGGMILTEPWEPPSF